MIHFYLFRLLNCRDLVTTVTYVVLTGPVKRKDHLLRHVDRNKTLGLGSKDSL